MKAAYGTIEDIKKVRSRGIVSIVIELPVESYKDAVDFLDDKRVLVTIAPDDIKSPYGVLDMDKPETYEPDREIQEKPYSRYAAALHKAGFFLCPKLWKAIGSPKDYEAWIRTQRCCITGGFDWDERNGEGRCEPSHVRRIEQGAGVAIKPDYWIVPMCHDIHINFQHQYGESAVYKLARQNGKAKGGPVSDMTLEAKDWLNKKAGQYVSKWAEEGLKNYFETDSLGKIEPKHIYAFAKINDLIPALPRIYKEEME